MSSQQYFHPQNVSATAQNQQTPQNITSGSGGFVRRPSSHHQLNPIHTNSGQILPKAPPPPVNIHVIPAHHHHNQYTQPPQQQITTHQQVQQQQPQIIQQPHNQSNFTTSPVVYSTPTIKPIQSQIAHSTITQQVGSQSLLSASINGSTNSRLINQNGTFSHTTTTPQHPQRVLVSPQPIIVSSPGVGNTTFTLNNGQQPFLQYVEVNECGHLHPQGTVVQAHYAYPQPQPPLTTSVAHQVPSPHHFHSTIPTTHAIQVIHHHHSNLPNHPTHRVPQTEQLAIYQPPSILPPSRTNQREVKYLITSTAQNHPTITPPQPTISFSPIKISENQQVSSLMIDEEKPYQKTDQYAHLYQVGSHVVNQLGNQLGHHVITQSSNSAPLTQPHRLSVYTVHRETGSQDTISPTTISTESEFEPSYQQSMPNSFHHRMRLDDKNMEDHHSFKRTTTASSVSSTEALFAKPTSASKLKMALDSQSLMVEKDESAETMDFNYYPKDGAVVLGEDTSDGKRSCSECRRVHKRCSKERPCLRCVRLGKNCVDLPEKKRGRPKKMDKPVTNNTATPSSSSSGSVGSSLSSSIGSPLGKMSLGSHSSLSSFGATPISTMSSLSDSFVSSSFGSQVSSASSFGSYMPSKEGKDTVLPSFSNLMMELDMRRQNNKL